MHISTCICICLNICVCMYTHTHLLRNILSNYRCGMHRPCKNTSVKPDRQWWMTRREKQYRRILSTTLLVATVPSDEVSSSSDCRSCTDIKWKVGLKNWKSMEKLKNRHAGSWLGRSPFRKMEKCRYVFTSYFQGLRWPWLGSRTQGPLLNGIGLCNTQKTFIAWRVTMQKTKKWQR